MCAEMMIIPRKAFDNAEGEDFNQHEMGRGCVGTGPYKIVKWETGKRMVLKRNDNHWKRTKPFFKEVHFIMVSEPSAALEMFKKGEIDVCGVSDMAWTKLTNSKSFKKRFIKYSYPTFAYSYITWNNKRVFFKDKRVRRAMTHLVDRKKFIETIMFGMAEVVTGPFYPTSQAYNHDVGPLEYDPERAKKLLDEAGWIDRDGDGIRENEDGVKFEFEFLVRNSPTSQKIATILQEELRKVGIIMKQRSLEWAIFLKYLYERNFDATTLGEKMGVDVGLHGMWHSSGAEYDVSANFANYVNKEVDKLIDESRAEFDEQKRYAILREAHRIIHEEQPFTFLMSGKNKVLINKRLTNVRYSAEGTLVEQWRAVPWDQIDYSQPWLREE
jgi:peptide/nickel transport system substrate-binding protein